MSDPDPLSQPSMDGPSPPGSPPATAVAVEDQPPQRDPFWSWGDVVVFLGLLFACVLGAAGLAQALRVLGPLSSVPLTHALVVAQFLAFGLATAGLALMFRARYAQPFWPAMRMRLDRWSIIPAFCSGMLVAIMVSVVNVLLRTKPVKNELEELMKDPTVGPVLALLGITLAPFFEELFFRGFIQPLLVRTVGALAGIAISGLMFALMHGPQYHWAWQYIVSVMLAGIAFAAVRHRTGSTGIAVLMHSGYNFTFFAVFFFVQRGF